MSRKPKPLLYSAESLRALDEIAGRLRGSLRMAAATRTRREGRDLVTDDDVRAALAEFVRDGGAWLLLVGEAPDAEDWT